MLDYNQLQLAQSELERPLSDLMAVLDNIEVDLPSFLGLEGSDSKSQQKLKFLALWSQSQEAICKNIEIKTLFNDDRAEGRAMLVCAIADYFTVHGAITLGAIIVKEGLHLLCAKHWAK